MPYTKVIQSGSLIEIFVYEKEPLKPKPRSRPYWEDEPSAEEGLESDKYNYPKRKRIFANLHRSKQRFLRLVRSNLLRKEAPALLTLTMLDIVSIDEAYKCFSKFGAKIRRAFGGKVVYVSVPEFQKRGAVHFHVLIWGFSEEIISHERGTRRIQNLWKYGYVDIRRTDGSEKLGGYLGKYMSKAMSDERLAGKKAFSVSRNAMRPVSLNTPAAIKQACRKWGITKKSVPNRERTYDTKWLGKCLYKSYSLPSIVELKADDTMSP